MGIKTLERFPFGLKKKVVGLGERKKKACDSNKSLQADEIQNIRMADLAMNKFRLTDVGSNKANRII